MPSPRAVPIHDPRRLAALRSLDLLDTAPEEDFDRYTRLAARLLDAPVALISLVDGDRQFFKSQCGLPEPLASARQTPLAHSLCRYAVEGGEPLVLADARAHPRFHDSPAVTEVGVVAYAGIPLATGGGQILGTLCVLDTRPREWTPEQLETLADLAHAVATRIELQRGEVVRERAEHALRDSQRMLSTLLDNLPGMAYRCRNDEWWTVEFASQGAAGLTGYPPAAFLGEGGVRFGDLIHPDDRARVWDAVQAALRERGSFQVEYRIHAAGGEERWVWEQGRGVGGDGVPAAVEGFIIDITERRRAAAAAAAVEAHYRRLVATSPYGIFALDAAGRCTEANLVLGEILGREVDDLLGREFADVVAPEHAERVAQALGRKLRGESEEEVIELHVARPGGERRVVEVSARTVREGQAITGVHGVVRDVTVERERERRVRLLASALENLDEAVSIIDPDTGRFVYANATHARLLGYPPGEYGRHHVDDFLPDDESRRELSAAWRDLRGGGHWSRSTRRRRVDGRVVPVQVLLSSVPLQDGTSLLFAILRDVTEERAREQHLRRVERLASLGTLLGGVAHELNNPLAAIKGFASLMLMDEHRPEDREALEVMQREADRAARIVSDLRRVARQTQEPAPAREPVDLNETVRHVARVREYPLRTGNVALHLDLAVPLPPVHAHRAQVEQVLLNLVVNAEQALAAWDGERRLVLCTRPCAEGVSLSVADTGPGIPREHLERVFDPFFTTKAPGEGTGLGLSLVHSIVAEHQGHLQVESEPGGGARFTVVLPRAPTGAGAGTAAPGDGTPPAPLRVLVVDDEEAVRRTLVRFLRRRGHRVEEAAEGAAALRRLRDPAAGEPFDVILSDLRMPGLSGDRLLRELRDDATGYEQRLVFITGDAASPGAARLLAEAGAPVVHKPFELAEVARVVEEVGGRGA